MKVIDQSFQVLVITPSPLQLIEKAGRVCYKSEDKITSESAPPFVSKLCHTLKHESVIEHVSATVLFTTDRGVTHEFVRHRLASYSQESTRYCNYSQGKFDSELTFIRPVYLDSCSDAYAIWRASCISAEHYYFQLLRETNSPQYARAALPNSLKSDLVVTANFRTWKHIFKLRSHPNAHPQFRALIQPLAELFHHSYPEIFTNQNENL